MQQFILYATSPGLKAVEVRDVPGEEHGAFTQALLDGLDGQGAAKAWSWERENYEVRWDRLVDYVRKRVEAEKREAGDAGGLLQVPQDTGSRGVAGRDRDAVIVSLPAKRFDPERLEVQLEPDSVYPKAGVVVLNAIGATVAEAVRLTGSVVTFELPPRTYALRAVAPDFKDGLLQPPVDLYGPVERQLISLRPLEEESTVSPTVVEPKPDPRIEVPPPDPLTVIEVRDETGDVKAVWRAASELPPVTPGFYRLRLVGPEASSEEQFVTLTPGETEKVEFACSPAAPFVAELGRAVGATTGPARRSSSKASSRSPGPNRRRSSRSRSPRRSTRALLRGRRSARVARPWRHAPSRTSRRGGDRRSRRLRGRIRDGEERADAMGDVRLRLWRAGEAFPRTTRRSGST